MFVEGTLRWQVTEDCPWDLLMALCLRDLAGLDDVGDPVLPPVAPAVQRILSLSSAPSNPASPHPRTDPPAVVTPPGAAAARKADLAEQWLAWWRAEAVRERRPLTTMLQPPHFAAFDRAIELQDLIMIYYDDAYLWSAQRHDEYARTSNALHARRAADIVDVVRDREHELRRQAGYFRLDISVLPLAEPGAWIVGPNSVVVSQSLRDDSAAFRQWFAPVVAALV